MAHYYNINISLNDIENNCNKKSENITKKWKTVDKNRFGECNYITNNITAA